jgi:hypothetical protein
MTCYRNTETLRIAKPDVQLLMRKMRQSLNLCSQLTLNKKSLKRIKEGTSTKRSNVQDIVDVWTLTVKLWTRFRTKDKRQAGKVYSADSLKECNVSYCCRQIAWPDWNTKLMTCISEFHFVTMIIIIWSNDYHVKHVMSIYLGLGLLIWLPTRTKKQKLHSSFYILTSSNL